MSWQSSLRRRCEPAALPGICNCLVLALRQQPCLTRLQSGKCHFVRSSVTMPCPADPSATQSPSQHLLQSEDHHSEPMEADGEPEYQPTPKGRRTNMGRRPAAAALPYPYELEEAQPMVEDMNAGGAAWEHFLEQQGTTPGLQNCLVTSQAGGVCCGGKVISSLFGVKTRPQDKSIDAGGAPVGDQNKDKVCAGAKEDV